MNIKWKNNKDLIEVSGIFLAIWAVAALFLVFEFGFSAVFKATVVYFVLTAIVSAVSYAIVINILRRVSIANSFFRIVAPTAIIMMGSIFNMWLVANYIQPLVLFSSETELAVQVASAFKFYAFFGAIMVLLSVSWAFETFRQELLEKVGSSIRISLNKDAAINIDFKEGDKA